MIETLLLPGLICDEAIWAHQVGSLGEQGVRAVHGYRLCRRIEDMADVVLEQAPEIFNLCGHSMGARVALEVYRKAPERVQKLALLDTGIHPRKSGEKEKRYALWELGKAQGIEALVDTWLPPMIAPANQNNEAMMQPMFDMACRGGVDGFEAQIHALLDRPEVDGLLPTINIPTIVGVGSEDIWSPVSQHRDIAARIPEAQVVVFAGAGHMAPIEAAEAVTESLGIWLSEDAAHR